MYKLRKTKMVWVFIIVVALSTLYVYAYTQTDKTQKNAQEPDLSSTSWQLARFNNKENVLPATLSFQEDVVGLQICNSVGFGKLDTSKSTIPFHTNATSTMMYCEGELGELELELTGILNKKMSYELIEEMKVLRIYDENNELIFSRN